MEAITNFLFDSRETLKKIIEEMRVFCVCCVFFFLLFDRGEERIFFKNKTRGLELKATRWGPVTYRIDDIQ